MICLNPEYSILAYKSLNPEYPFWDVKDYSANKEEYYQLQFGSVVSADINYTIRKSYELNGYVVSNYDNILKTEYIGKIYSCYLKPVPNLTQEKLDKLINYINDLFNMCEIAKSRGRGRHISQTDYNELYPFFLKLKDVPFIAENAHIYGQDFIYDYLNTNGLLQIRDYNKIIKKGEIVTEKSGTKFQLYQLSDLEALFSLDLEEVMFGTMKAPKYQMCVGCGEIFVTNHRNNCYCGICNNNERVKKRKQESRKKPLNHLAEKINNKYRYLLDQANNNTNENQMLHIDNDTKAQRIFDDWRDFKDELYYYKKIINSSSAPTTINPKYDASINTEDKLIEWLNKRRDQLKGEKNNAQNDETLERDRHDHEGEREETEAL